MAIAAVPLDRVPLDSAATRPAAPARPLDPIVRSPCDDATRFDAEAELSFGDFLDAINPLHHIPIVGTLYRAVTGDTIKPSAQVVGGTLFGGPIGGVTAFFSAAIAQANGSSLEDQALAALGFGSEPAAVAVAEAPPAPAPQPPAAAQAPPATPAPPPAPAVAMAAPTAPQPTQPALRTETVALMGERTPSKMPARDTMLANTLQARQIATMPPRTPVARPVAPPAEAPVAAAAPGPAGTPPREMISDVMMRNLAKYEAAKRALNPTPPTVQVSG